MITFEFLLTSLIVVLVPGTGVIFTISTGILQGKRASIYAAIGCTAGIIPHLLATVFGLAAVMQTSAVAFQTIKYAGVLYLFYVACMTWKDRSALNVSGQTDAGSASQLILKAFLLNILNPKLTFFFLAFLPQYVVAGQSHALTQLLKLSAVFMGMTFAVFVVYGVCAHAFRAAVIDSPTVQKRLQRAFAAAFAFMGIQLALADR